MTEWLHFHFSLSCIGEGNGNPLQCSCLENPGDGGAWWVAVYRVAQSWVWLKWLSSNSSSSSSSSSITHPSWVALFSMAHHFMQLDKAVIHVISLVSFLWLWLSICLSSDDSMDLTEAEDIKKRWQEYIEELYKKDLHDADNHDGVITHLEPDILECEVKWALWWNSSWAISNPKRWCCESAAFNRPANLENSAVATGLEKVSFHSNPKERQCQRMLKLLHNCTHLTR